MAGSRSIFVEVGDQGSGVPDAPKAGIIAPKSGARRGIRAWLILLFVLVAAMIVVGGLTRLTDSGLSITEWRPVTGAIPPLNDADWLVEFQKYQASPQYALMNSQMTLDGFKTIFWWEWAHRQLGRTIGLIWALGFFGFLVARAIPQGWTGRLFGIGAMIGVQGAVGWWMVSSGLTGQMVSVASYRLATHLGIAFAILGVLAWSVFSLGRDGAALLQARRSREAKLFSLSTGVMHFLFLQILLGALVAGIDAGRAFPTWPDMNGQFFPADAFYVPDGQGGTLPLWHAFFENAGLVQFIHRMSGYLLLTFGVVAWLRGRKSAHRATRVAFHAMFGMLLLQVALGIGAALSAAQLHAAITHQIGAVVLWVLVLRARFLSQYPIVGSIRGGAL